MSQVEVIPSSVAAPTVVVQDTAASASATSGVKRSVEQMVITSEARVTEDDPYFLSEMDPTSITYKDFATSSSGGELAFASYKGARVFVETEVPVVLGYKGLGQYIEVDEKKKKAQKKAHNDFSIVLFAEANPEIASWVSRLDAHNIAVCSANAEKPEWFGESKDIKTITENLYRSTTKTKHKTKGKIPPEIKFKVPANQDTGLPVMEIYDHMDNLVYRHCDTAELNAEDKAQRESFEAGFEWQHPTELLKGGERVFLSIQYTGLYKIGQVGTAVKILRVKKTAPKKRRVQAFRSKIVAPVEESAEVAPTSTPSPVAAVDTTTTTTVETTTIPPPLESDATTTTTSL